MTLDIPAALPLTPIHSGFVSPRNVNSGATLAPQISSPQDSGPAMRYPVGTPEAFGLTTGNNTAEALREQAALTAANTIRWTPWQRTHSPGQKGPGTWINVST
jgi:hypothetical protein